MKLRGVCPICTFPVDVIQGLEGDVLAAHVGDCAGGGQPAAEPVRRWVAREVATARLMLAGAAGRRLSLAAALARAQADLATHDAGVALASSALEALEPLLPSSLSTRPGPPASDEGA